jgi:hypothetical protein
VAPGPGIHPREACRPTDSQAERAVWAALKAGLPAGWYGWHSLRIRDRDRFDGEGDFVLAHPERGLLVLEVKGGRVEQLDGRWFQNGKPLDEAPLDQGRRFAHRLVARLRERALAPPAFGAAVAFPDVFARGQPTQDDLAGLVLGRDELRYLREALPAVVERAMPRPGASRGQWIAALHQLWGETWVPSLSLGVRLQELEERRLALDEQQLLVLEGLLENDRVLIEGGAGSGKTLLAAEAARRIAGQGRKVLLLCFTAPLQKWLAARVEGIGVEVQTISGFAKRLVDAAGGSPDLGALTGNEYWRIVYERADGLCRPVWDAVVVDEAQDLQFEAWVLVSTLSQGKRLWAFHDPDQGFWQDRSPPADLFATRYRLPRQQRCPPGVQALADQVRGLPFDEAALAAACKDGTVAFVTAPSATSVPEKVGEEVDRLLSGGLTPGQIGIVSLRGQTPQGAIYNLAKVGRHAIVHADHEEMESRLVADTFLRWKGLERPAIVVADLPEGDLSRLPVRLNVALSRATLAVRCVGTASSLARLLPPPPESAVSVTPLT